MTDEQRLALNVFCDCPEGQQERHMIERRVNVWREWQASVQAQNQAQAGIVASWGRIPEKFSGFTLAGLRKMASVNGDLDDKQKAITAAVSWMQNGYVVSKRGTQKHSLLIWSDQRGVGKSGTAAALFSEWLRRGKSGLWIDFFDFIPLVRSTYGERSTQDKMSLIRPAQQADLLVLDELGDPGRGAPETDHTRDVLNEIVRYRHQRDLPTLFTTNADPMRLAEQFSEDFSQRVLEMAVAVEMGGQCLRDLG